ncbi:hypothetical protein [Nonomuraea polychroma]|uniref:hypothetical protein n=1 Tax=Nonomuraea polychroma TaxID=46176 RepID=UPI0019D434D6|nr:hypothetical protein [Nonomuraea polychroma]
MDGIVISEPIDEGAELVRADVPVLVYSTPLPFSAPRVVTAGVGSDELARAATEHLLDLGHATVHHVAGPQRWYAARERLAVWRAAHPSPPARRWSSARGTCTCSSPTSHGVPVSRPEERPGIGEKATVSLAAAASDPAGTALHANTTGHGYVFTAGGRVADLGLISFDQAQKGSVTLPETITAGTKFKIAVVFDDTPLMWDSATVRAAAAER